MNFPELITVFTRTKKKISIITIIINTVVDVCVTKVLISGLPVHCSSNFLSGSLTGKITTRRKRTTTARDKKYTLVHIKMVVGEKKKTIFSVENEENLRP